MTDLILQISGKEPRNPDQVRLWRYGLTITFSCQTEITLRRKMSKFIQIARYSRTSRIHHYYDGNEFRLDSEHVNAGSKITGVAIFYNFQSSRSRRVFINWCKEHITGKFLYVIREPNDEIRYI